MCEVVLLQTQLLQLLRLALREAQDVARRVRGELLRDLVQHRQTRLLLIRLLMMIRATSATAAVAVAAGGEHAVLLS